LWNFGFISKTAVFTAEFDAIVLDDHVVVNDPVFIANFGKSALPIPHWPVFPCVRTPMSTSVNRTWC